MENIGEWLHELNISEKSVIVEGKKDVKALRAVGVKNKIVTLSKAPLFGISEKVSGEEVAILTDFDKKGKELYGKLVTELQSLGVKVDHFFREWLQKNTKLSHIEGIDKLVNQ